MDICACPGIVLIPFFATIPLHKGRLLIVSKWKNNLRYAGSKSTEFVIFCTFCARRDESFRLSFCVNISCMSWKFNFGGTFCDINIQILPIIQSINRTRIMFCVFTRKRITKVSCRYGTIQSAKEFCSLIVCSLIGLVFVRFQ